MAGLTGATPTPQLPMTTVVTPCQGELVRSGSQATLGVVVGGRIDKPRRQDQAVGVHGVPGGQPRVAAEVRDTALRDAQCPHKTGGPGAITDTSLLDNQIEHGALPSCVPAALAHSAGQTHGACGRAVPTPLQSSRAPAVPVGCSWSCAMQRAVLYTGVVCPTGHSQSRVRLLQAIEGFGPTGQNAVLGRC
jgi:hypothetical protein